MSSFISSRQISLLFPFPISAHDRQQMRCRFEMIEAVVQRKYSSSIEQARKQDVAVKRPQDPLHEARDGN